LRLCGPDPETNTRDACATGRNRLHRGFYFLGVGEGLVPAPGVPVPSTAKVQCASTFFPPDFASTMTVHVSLNSFVTSFDTVWVFESLDADTIQRPPPW